MKWLAARRRKRLEVKLNRAWWKTAYLSADALRQHKNSDRWWGISEDLYAILEAMKAGEPVDAPFPPREPESAYTPLEFPGTR